MYHIQGDKLNCARARKDRYDDELFDDSDNNSDKLAAKYASKNGVAGNMDEIEDERKMPALPAGLPADVGIKKTN